MNGRSFFPSKFAIPSENLFGDEYRAGTHDSQNRELSFNIRDIRHTLPNQAREPMRQNQGKSQPILVKKVRSVPYSSDSNGVFKNAV